MPPTLKDVAERAGVSIKTVSNVVNGYAFITPATRERVSWPRSATPSTATSVPILSLP